MVIAIICLILSVVAVIALLRSLTDQTPKSPLVNFLAIADLDAVIATLPIADPLIDIESLIPDTIRIASFADKGWGLVANRMVHRGELIYECPLARFPSSDLVIRSAQLGDKKIDKEVHLSEICKEHDIFCYYDCLLNHSSESNASHDVRLAFRPKGVFIRLIATTDIQPGDEITIHYFYDINWTMFLMRSLWALTVDALSFGAS
jgi:hypothetical protein